MARSAIIVATVATPPDLRGVVLDGRYRIIDLLGQGGMGNVYEAVHVTLDKRLAIKTLHPRLAHDERFRERFLREAKAASTIHHPNVVQIMDFGDTPDGSVYFVMEFLDGKDLRALLKQRKKLPWSETQAILQQATSALAAAHRHNIIHRDIKPGNCFLTPIAGSGQLVKLLDFGIAKVGAEADAAAGAAALTGTGEVFGTATYMAPEQARGKNLDARSDIYSLGIMAYEMLTGQVPYTGVNPIHVITRHLSDDPKPLREHDASIPAAVEALVLQTMAKKPEDRPASMGELEAAMMAIPAEVAKPRKPRVTVPKLGAKLGPVPKLGPPPPIPGAARRPRRTLLATTDPTGAPLEPASSDAVPQPRSKVPTAPAAEASAEAASGDSSPPPSRRGRRVTLVASEPPAAQRAIKRTLLSSEASGELLPSVGAESSAVQPIPDAGTRPPPASASGTTAAEATSPHAASALGTGPLAQQNDGEFVQTGSQARLASGSLPRVDPPQRRPLGTIAAVLGIAALGVVSMAITLAMTRDEEPPTATPAANNAAAAVSPADSAATPEPPPAAAATPAAGPAVDAPPVADTPTLDAPPPQLADETPTSADDPPPAVEPQAEAEPEPEPAPESVEPEPEPVEPTAVDTEPEPELIIEDEDETPSRPNHLTQACADRRAAAEAAKKARDWRAVIKTTALGSCWSSAQQRDRKAMRVLAYVEVGNFKKCVAVGRYVKDPGVKRIVEQCKAKL